MLKDLADLHNDWTDEEVFHTGDEFFSNVLTAIGLAKRSVEIEIFIFKDDKLGRQLINALKSAALRRVRVKLLVDGFGSWDLSRAVQREFKNAGIDCRFFHPLPWHPSAEGLVSGLVRFNLRNHRKLWIIDHEVAFLGSMNVSEVHSEAIMGKLAWRDIGVRVRGPGLVWLRAAFESVWQSRSRAKHWRDMSKRIARLGHNRSGRDLVELNQSLGSRRKKNRRLVERIRSAQHRVWLVNPYFVPSYSLLKALSEASGRGVNVKIIVPKYSDIFFMPVIARKYYGWLLKHGVLIKEYRPSMMHAKIALIDDWLRVGSSNLNQRSLLHDLEVNVILRKDRSLKTIENQIRQDIEESVQVNLNDWRRRGWIRWALEHVIGLFRRWL